MGDLILEVIRGQSRGRKYRLDKNSMIIGRGHDVDVVLRDPGASRQHARIFRTEDGCAVEDLKSMNGTEVDGRSITRAPVRPGMIIRICGWEAKLLEEAEPKPAVAGPEVTLVEDAGVSTSGAIQEMVDASKSLVVEPPRIESVHLDQAYSRLKLLIEIGEAMAVSQTVEELLNLIMDRLFDVFPAADNGLIMLFNPETGELEPKINRNTRGDQDRIVVSRTIADMAVKERKSLLVSDAQQDQRFSSALSVVNLKMRSTMCVPLLHGGNVLGLIQVTTARPGKRFQRDELNLLTALGAEAALAIENASLVVDLKRTNEELKKTLREIDMLRNVKEHMSKFVPEAARRRIEENPETPGLEKRDQDVSIVFLDIEGYTLISESRDQSRVDYIVERYFSRFLDSIYKYGGDINEIAGDGLMIIFQHEDAVTHASNAVGAAVEIRRETERINNEHTDKFDPIMINFGINSGTASVGSVRFEGYAGTRWTFTAGGPTTIMAARLAALANEGAILIGPETAARAGARFDLADIGERELKNMRAQVRVHRVIDRKADQGTGE